jgi:hypothetical protein
MIYKSEDIHVSRISGQKNYLKLRKDLMFQWASENLTGDHKIIFKGLLNLNETERWTMSDLVRFIANSTDLHGFVNIEESRAVSNQAIPKRQSHSLLLRLKNKIFG